MEQPIKKNKLSYFARSRLRLRPQEIWERDYIIFGLDALYGCISLFIKYYMKMKSSKSGYAKGVSFFNKRYIKGVPFLRKWYIKG